MKRSKRFVALAVLSVSAAANAATVFDFTGPGSPNFTIAATGTFVSGGVTLVVSAQETTDAARTVWADLAPASGINFGVNHTTSNGLGVKSHNDANGVQIDSVESNERLLFDFDQDVNVLSISFKNSGTNDTAQVGLFDGTTDTALGVFTLGSAVFTKTVNVDVPNGSKFYLAAIPTTPAVDHTTDLSGDWFAVSALSATPVDLSPTLTTVPLPAGGLATVSLLAGLSLVRRGRRTIV